MTTVAEILNDVKAGKQPQPVAQWVEAHIPEGITPSESARIKSLAKAQSDALAALVTGNDSGVAVAATLAQSLNSPEWSFGRDAIPLYLSVIAIIQTAKLKGDSKLFNALSIFERAQFDHLPQLARLDILNKRLLPSAAQINILAELQAVYSVEEFWDDGTWSKPYIEALLNNQETLGKESLVLNNASVPPTVGNWLRDFVTTLPQQFETAVGVYDQVHYLNASPLVTKLTDNDKSLLSNILRLYSWLTDPVVNEAELQAYEAAKAAALDQSLGISSTLPQGPLNIPVAVLGKSTEVPLEPQWSEPSQFAPSQTNGKSAPTINMQDILNRRGQGGGIVYDNGTNVKVEEIGQRLEAERQQKQSDIDKKLEDLKKRRLK